MAQPILQILRVALLALLALWAAPALAVEGPPSDAQLSQRGAFTEIIGKLRSIHTPNGIDTLEQVEIGGVKQWISIRGRDKANPVLLVLHGGPGTPTLPLAWAYQNGWEDYFTVVNWEQRGAGKNWQSTDGEKLAPTMSLDRLVDDAAEVIGALRGKLGQRRVVVMGFSYGTWIGTALALKHPELISAYVGVGQVFDDAERDVYNGGLAEARAQHNEAAIKGLEALAPYPNPDGSVDITKIVAVRKWVKAVGGGWYGWSDLELLYQLPVLSPEYDAKDLAGWPIGNSWFGMSLGKELKEGPQLARRGLAFKVPVFFFMGRHDLMTPYVTAQRYFGKLSAPGKTFVTFENASHFVMLEEPGRFLIELVGKVRPVATARE